MNQIEEIFIIQDQEKNKPINDAISTEILIQDVKKQGKSNQIFIGLLDTGATGIFIKRTALKNFDHKINKTNVQVKGRYAFSNIKEVASFTIRLPDFCSNKTIDVQAYIEDEVIGRHDIILGIRFIRQIGLIFDFKRQILTWDEISLPMRQLGSIKSNELVTVEAPAIIQKAINRLDQSITSNSYNINDYRTMILNCTHLNPLHYATKREHRKQIPSLLDPRNVRFHAQHVATLLYLNFPVKIFEGCYDYFSQ